LPDGTQRLWLARPRLQDLLDALAERGYAVHGPVVVDGAIRFDPVRSVEDLPVGWRDHQSPGRYRLEHVDDERVFGVVNGPGSLKPFVFAPREPLLEVEMEGGPGRPFRAHTTLPERRPVAVLGVRACDLAGLRVQDRIFMHDLFPDPYYATRRSDLFVVAVHCTRSVDTCFCTSMGTGPEATGSFDVALLEQEDGFVAQAGSPAGEALLAALALPEASAERRVEARRELDACAEGIGRRLDTRDMPSRVQTSLHVGNAACVFARTASAPSGRTRREGGLSVSSPATRSSIRPRLAALLVLLLLTPSLPAVAPADEVPLDERPLPVPEEAPPPAPPPPTPAPAPEPVAQACPLLPDLQGYERDARWDGFQTPLVQPFLFEDPFIVTGLYPYYAWHDFPESSVFEGGDAHLAAVQARVAITCRLGFFAIKDGYVWQDPDRDLLDSRRGFIDIAFGFKYALIEDRESGFILTPSLRFEIPVGATDVLAGNGDGVVIPAVAAGWAPGNGDLHLIADLGLQVPFDSREQSHSLFYHLYADYAVTPWFQPFVQISGLHWWNSGNGKLPVQVESGTFLPLTTAQDALGTGRFEGADVFNLGSKGVDGRDYVTWAVGTHIPITEHLTFSLAYERPLFSNTITRHRVTTALRVEF